MFPQWRHEFPASNLCQVLSILTLAALGRCQPAAGSAGRGSCPETKPRARAAGSDDTKPTPCSAARERPAGPRSAQLVLTPLATRDPSPTKPGGMEPSHSRARLEVPRSQQRGRALTCSCLPLPAREGGMPELPLTCPAAPVQLPQEHHRAQANGNLYVLNRAARKRRLWSLSWLRVLFQTGVKSELFRKQFSGFQIIICTEERRFIEKDGKRFQCHYLFLSITACTELNKGTVGP